MGVKRLSDESGGVGGDGGFLLFAGGMAGANVKPREQQGDAEHGAARIGGQGAGSRGIEEAKQAGEKRLCPHGRIFRGRKGIEQNGVRSRNGPGGWMGEEGGKIAEVEFPINFTTGIREPNGTVAQKSGDGFFVVVEVAENLRIIESELKRFDGVIEADDPERAIRGTGGAQNGQDIRGGAEADVPDDEFAGMSRHAFRKPKLADVKGLGLGDRTDDGMEGFAMRDGMDAVNAAGELDDLIGGG